jgi:site-specific DNA recombinase
MSVTVAPPAASLSTVRYAFLGRVSTEDQQDPSLSIPRQLAACERVVRETGGGAIVAFFWDIESGRKELSTRGHGADSASFGVPVRRDGGIAELRASASNGRPFDAVIVESIDRLARMTADATAIERELEHLDIGLFASDEPMIANATAILTRRVKQGVAEWYVRDLMEKSRRGMEESVKQGWHAGGPVAYGYALEPHPHPNPHKAAEGKKKHRLVPDPVRAPIVLMIFSWYCVRLLGMGEICDRLNRDLDRYPPPRRNRKDENDLPQTWSKAQIQSMLRNPKYTGFNVWNRHDKRRGRPLIRPKEQWVWSAEPVHEPIVPRELFEQVEDRARRNTIRPKRRAANAYPQRSRGRTGRLYPLRGRVRCGLCGRRMEGSHQKGANWYRCRFVWNRGAIAADRAGHPRALGIRESDILDHLLDFMGSRLFGPERLRLLRHELADTADGRRDDHEDEMRTLRNEREQVDRALYRQTLRLEEHDDPYHPVVVAAKKRIEELSARRIEIDDALTALDAQRPDEPDAGEIEKMLDAVPDLRPTLHSAAPEELAELFEAFDVAVAYDKPNRTLTLAATVAPELVPRNTKPRPAEKLVGEFVYSGGGIRTRDLRVMSPTSYQTAPPRGVD